MKKEEVAELSFVVAVRGRSQARSTLAGPLARSRTAGVAPFRQASQSVRSRKVSGKLAVNTQSKMTLIQYKLELAASTPAAVVLPAGAANSSSEGTQHILDVRPAKCAL